jgi:DNA-binding SARP family transcriptional activator
VDPQQATPQRVELRILGPVEVHLDARPVHLTGLQRSLLAMLALGGGQVLSGPRLAAGLWEPDLPTAAPARVRMLVSELRKALPGVELIVTRSPGYRVEPSLLRLDSVAFTATIEQAHAARSRGRLDESAQHYASALDAWRGPALGGAAPGPFVTGQSARLEEARQQAVEDRAEVDLARGNHAEAIDALSELTELRPPRDRSYHLLMLAHYRSGRSGEALRVYQSARERYHEDLGLEPGPALTELHQQILRADPTLDTSNDGFGGASDSDAMFEPIRPAELPPDLGDFSGRDAEVTAILDLLEGTTAPVVALHGKPGVGKSALTVHVAHLLRSRFPDGQIYVDLEGAGPRPADPHEVLGRFLNTLGLCGQSIPHNPAARAALYRSVLADQRILLILDNAASATQVRTLLPGTPSCAVIITSRMPLAAPLGARALAVDVLDPIASRRLVETIIGDGRARSEPDEIDRLVALCGRLPLALRVAAGRLAESPHWRIATMVERLTDEHHRLDELRHGGVDIRATLQISYSALSQPAAAGLRLLGALPAGDFARWTAAALFDVSVSDVDPVIDELIRAGLLDYCRHDRTGEARYRLHDLIRSFAVTILGDSGDPVGREHAEQRLFGAWLAASTAAANELPCRPITVLAGPGGAAPVPGYRIEDAIAWFESERAGLLAIVRRAATRNSSYAYQIASAAAKFLELRGDFDDWSVLYRCGLAAAAARGDHSAVAYLRCGLAAVDRYQDRYDEARRGYGQARAHFAEVNDVLGMAIVDAGLAVVLRTIGDVDRASDLWADAIAAFTSAGDELRAAQVRYSAAVAHCDLRNWGPAADLLNQALPVLEAAGDRETECRAWGVLGLTHLRRDELDQAKEYLDRSLRLTDELGLLLDGAYARWVLAEWHAAQGANDRARELVTVSLRMVRASRDRNGEVRMLSTMAKLFAAEQRFSEALEVAEESVRISLSVGNLLLASQMQDYVDDLRQAKVQQLQPQA